MKLRLGTDPEMFLRNLKTGYYVSAHGLFPGTKDDPFKLDKGAMQVDGLALEFNIDPADSEDEFATNIEVVLAQIKEKVREVDADLGIEFIPFARFEPKYFEALPDECKILGCDPDYAFTGVMKTPPEGLSDKPFRTAAGHIHIGWTEGQDLQNALHVEDARFIAQKFYEDAVFAATTHIENTRLDYYGAHGAFRPKSYGVELREPSNLWVATDAGRREAYRKVIRTMESIG